MKQAAMLRDFVSRAEAYGIDYNVIEAIDQPWKTMEGGVGPYWGLLDASRHAKFAWTGPITNPDYLKRAGACRLARTAAVAADPRDERGDRRQALTLPSPPPGRRPGVPAIVAFWTNRYFVPGAAFALGLGIVLLIPLVAIAFARIEEIAAVAFGNRPRRLAVAPPLVPEAYAPKVSIHIPAYCEQPDMLNATLDAVARLEYPNFECILVINNTPDPTLWRPVEEHCATLGERFKFLRVEISPASRPARYAWRSRTRRPTPRSSPPSIPITWSKPTGSRTWCRCLPIRASASCSRRRIIATALAP